MADDDGDRDVELEDGECSDTDDEQTPFTNAPSLPFMSGKNFASQSSSSYSSRIPQIVINSDESDDSSGDEYPTAGKKARSPSDRSPDFEYNRSDKPFVNPLLSNSSAKPALMNNQQRKKNNIWGSVLCEQVLSQEVMSFGVNNPQIEMRSRDVESYDYTKAKEDERPELDLETDDINDAKDDIFGEVVDLEKEVKRHESRKRKHARDRLGKRSYNRHKKRTLGVTANDEVADVVSAITAGLSEPKVDLFTRIVEAIGKELAIKFYYMTEDVEEAGGMMTNDGFRRRTPGGVYIQLLRSDTSLSADTISVLFEDEHNQWRQQLRQQRKIRKAKSKRRKRQMRREMDIDRPDTPTPAEDLEVLNALDSNNEFDATDLPERPATPEPKDDSSDGQDEDGEEEDDDEDISVAIARAKAAILKKQRELASEAVTEEKESGKNLVEHPGENVDGCGSGWRDNEMAEDGDSCTSVSKMSTHDVDIGEME